MKYKLLLAALVGTTLTAASLANATVPIQADQAQVQSVDQLVMDPELGGFTWSAMGREAGKGAIGGAAGAGAATLAFGTPAALPAAALGGEVVTDHPVRHLGDLPPAPITLLDLGPRPVLELSGTDLPGWYRRALGRYRYGPGRNGASGGAAGGDRRRRVRCRPWGAS